MVLNNLLVFEGVDGSGKSTQIKKILSKLSKESIDFSIYREPGSEPLSERIREILLDKTIDITDEAEMMLFLAARAQLTKKHISKDLKKGKLVVCDRFIDSTLVYQGYGKVIDKELIRICNNFVTDSIYPKLVIIMDIDYETFLERRRKDIDRMEANSKVFFKNVIDGYRELSFCSPDKYILIDGKLPVDEIHDLIWSKILKIFNL